MWFGREEGSKGRYPECYSIDIMVARGILEPESNLLHEISLLWKPEFGLDHFEVNRSQLLHLWPGQVLK
jgi:hypothetical protein